MHTANGLGTAGSIPCGKAKTHSAEYNINKQYDTLTFNIQPYSDFKDNGWAYINVYADDVLRYTSERITQKTQPFSVQIDIYGANQLKIMVYTDKYSCVMLTDVLLAKLPNYISTNKSGYTSLSQVKTFNGSLEWENGYPSDVHETSYSDVSNYTILHAANGLGTAGSIPCGKAKTYSVEYYVNKQYSSISFDIAPSAEFGSAASSIIKIYGDDTLIYTSPIIKQKTARFNTGAIDVSNSDYIKIIAEVSNYGCTIISDALLAN